MAIVLLMCHFKTVRGSRYPDSYFNCDFNLSERLSSSYFMPVCYLFLQLSFAIQSIIQFHSDLGGGVKNRKNGSRCPTLPFNAILLDSSDSPSHFTCFYFFGFVLHPICYNGNIPYTFHAQTTALK